MKAKWEAYFEDGDAFIWKPGRGPGEYDITCYRIIDCGNEGDLVRDVKMFVREANRASARRSASRKRPSSP